MSGEALDSRCRTLERLASEVSRLSYHAAKGKVSLATTSSWLDLSAFLLACNIAGESLVLFASIGTALRSNALSL